MERDGGNDSRECAFSPLGARRAAFLIAFYMVVLNSFASDTTALRMRGVFSPNPKAERGWDLSIGVLTYTTPQALTEEVRVRVPAGDAHAVLRMGSGWSAEGRLLFQVVQNHLSAGMRYAVPINRSLSFGFGDDLAYWRGNLPIDGFDAKGSGWMNYPNVSLGFRSDQDLLFTLKAEALISLNRSYVIAGDRRSFDVQRNSGYALSLYLEQPFFKTTQVTLGFTAAYSRFMWATWSLFQPFDRRVFYPQISMSLIL